jgi:hypothetical protein
MVSSLYNLEAYPTENTPFSSCDFARGASEGEMVEGPGMQQWYKELRPQIAITSGRQQEHPSRPSGRL